MGNNSPYKEDIEMRFINKLLTGIDTFSIVSLLGMSKDYLKEYSTIYAFEIIKEYSEISNNSVPPAEYVMTKLNAHPDESIEGWKVEEEGMTIQGLIEELKDQHFKMNLVRIQGEFTKLIKEGRKSTDIKQIINAEIQSLDFTSDDGQSFTKFSDIDKRVEKYLQKLEGDEFEGKSIPFPFAKFNEEYNGLRDKDLVYVVAPQKTGKTFLLNEFCITAFENSKKVLVISPEMSEAEILERIDGRILGLNYSKIGNGNLTEAEVQKYKNKKQEYAKIIEKGGEIILVDKAPNGFNFDYVVSLIEKHEPELVIIDGLTLLTTDSKEGGTSDWLAAKKISEKIKNNICNAKQIPVVVAVQATNNEDTLDKEVFTSDNIARAKQILQDCDLAFGLSKSTSRGAGKRVFATIDGRRGKKCILGLDFDIGNGNISVDDALTNELVEDFKDEEYV